MADLKVYPPPSSYKEEEDAQSKKRKRTANGSAVTVDETYEDVLKHVKYPSVVHANQNLVTVHKIVKRECEQCAELVDQVKLWVNLTMPKIEDGDNFGVQVQEEVLAELQRAQESSYNLRDAARQDHLTRAKISSKLIKYPHVEDYVLALREHDEKNLYFARQHLVDLRNIYAVLTDIIHKNISKIRAPKGNNSIGLY
ncbi:hypothetical protein HGRIS_008164 [Hohenbuehelia grisea]|uniref:Proteasome activator PA28 C-terminal domain-containing protein n=1 Tax=Hohenbuehelia grisea TaxID=104357 RepID=A0ABR3J7Y0_9AGAR